MSGYDIIRGCSSKIYSIEAAFPDDVASMMLTDRIEKRDYAEKSDEGDGVT